MGHGGTHHKLLFVKVGGGTHIDKDDGHGRAKGRIAANLIWVLARKREIFGGLEAHHGTEGKQAACILRAAVGEHELHRVHGGRAEGGGAGRLAAEDIEIVGVKRGAEGKVDVDVGGRGRRRGEGCC